MIRPCPAHSLVSWDLLDSQHQALGTWRPVRRPSLSRRRGTPPQEQLLPLTGGEARHSVQVAQSEQPTVTFWIILFTEPQKLSFREIKLLTQDQETVE